MAKIKIDKDRCKGCELCVINCPKKLIALSESVNSFGLKTAKVKSSKGCIGCAFCAIVCPECIITVWK